MDDRNSTQRRTGRVRGADRSCDPYSRMSRLVLRPDVLFGDPEELVHLEWLPQDSPPAGPSAS